MTLLALGTVQFGLAYGISGASTPVDPVEAQRILEAARKANIVRLDVAPAYGNIEERLGAMIADLDFSVVSKLPGDCSGVDLRDCLERSHRRLAPHLKGLLFHNAGTLQGASGAGIWSHAQEVAAEFGLALGASYYDPQQLMDDIGRLPAMAMAQLPASAFDQRLLDVAGALSGIEVTVRSAFLQGLLLLDPEIAVSRVPASANVMRLWASWCKQQRLSPLVAAFSLVKGMRPDYVVVGVDNVVQLHEITAAWSDSEPHTAPELATLDCNIFDPRRWPVLE